MKVYLITMEPFPNGMAGTNRIKCYVKALQRQGIPCEVIICTRTEVYGTSPKNTVGKADAEGISYRYIGGTPLRHKNILVRQINDVVDRLHTIGYLLSHLCENDIVLSYCGTHTNYINLIIDVAHKKKAKFVRELCELPYGTVMETKKTLRCRQFALTKQFPKCDGFIAISDALVELAEQYKNPNALVLKVPILVDLEKYCIPDRSEDTPIPYIFHSGTLSEQKDGILGMIEAFGIATRKLSFPIMFISTGKKEKSPNKEDIDRLIIKFHLETSVIFTGYLPENDLRNYLSKASLVVINKYNTQQNKYCFSTKLGEYLAASKPVIITNIGEAMNWLTDNQNAYIVEPENTSALAERIIEAFSNDQKRHLIAQNGFNTCKSSFDYKNYGCIIKDFFYKIVKYGD